MDTDEMYNLDGYTLIYSRVGKDSKDRPSVVNNNSYV